ncbi:heat shock [Perkinsus olseni]|uniref:Heat shock n=1 Tax=Perkinsus olseni TaxID=32597 RepID=A0A7J6NRW7_PEROL|nr:heat shock [Perkinsus olseni]
MREGIMKTLSESEDWLYEDGFDAQLEEYKKRLEGLKKDVVPVLFRADEVELRADLPEWVSKKSALDVLAQQVLTNRTWVANETAWKVGNDTDDFETWFKDLQEKQEATALTEEPAFKVLDVKKRLASIGKAANQLMKIKKPAAAQPKKDDLLQPEKLREIIRNITQNDTTYDASKLDKMSSNELLTEYLSLVKPDKEEATKEEATKEEGKEKEEDTAAAGSETSEGPAESDTKEGEAEEKPHDEL